MFGATLLALSVASPALADSATITFTDAAGTSDPAVGLGRTMTVSGNSATSAHVYVLVRPAGGAPCAPSASSDAGTTSTYGGFSGDDFYGYATVNGNFTLRKTGTWSTPGTFMFCIWLASSSRAPATPFTQNITFRRPTGTISATVAPVAPLAGQSAAVTITGSSEAPMHVYGDPARGRRPLRCLL